MATRARQWSCVCPLCGKAIPLLEQAVEALRWPGIWFHAKCAQETFPLLRDLDDITEELYVEWKKLNS